jgi:hypothetical protein
LTNAAKRLFEKIETFFSSAEGARVDGRQFEFAKCELCGTHPINVSTLSS